MTESDGRIFLFLSLLAVAVVSFGMIQCRLTKFRKREPCSESHCILIQAIAVLFIMLGLVVLL